MRKDSSLLQETVARHAPWSVGFTLYQRKGHEAI